MRRALTTAELRHSKATRDEFLIRPRRPITVVLDGVSQNYNIGAIFRLCDAFLVEQLVICGTPVNLRKRKLVQAAQGTQRWVPWSERQRAIEAVADAKAQDLLLRVNARVTRAGFDHIDCDPLRDDHKFPPTYQGQAHALTCSKAQPRLLPTQIAS